MAKYERQFEAAATGFGAVAGAASGAVIGVGAVGAAAEGIAVAGLAASAGTAATTTAALASAGGGSIAAGGAGMVGGVGSIAGVAASSAAVPVIGWVVSGAVLGGLGAWGAYKLVKRYRSGAEPLVTSVDWRQRAS